MKVYFSPEGVAALRPSWMKPPVSSFAAHRDADVAPGDKWESALDNLERVVHDLGGGTTDVVLSNHFLHYQLLASSDKLRNAEEQVSYARYLFHKTYGGKADTWKIALSDVSPASECICVAYDDGLVRQIDERITRAGGRLTSLRPSFTVAANHWRKQIGASGSVWFIVHEPGVLTLSLIENGTWKWLRKRRVSSGWMRDLPEMVLEETMMVCAALESAPTVCVFSPLHRQSQGSVNSRQAGITELTVQQKREKMGMNSGWFEYLLVG